MNANAASEPGTFEVIIERILPGGMGLAHADDRTVMVALAAPADRLRVRVDRVKGSVAFASIVEILEASPLRVEPPCPYFGRCGGCDFQQLNYQAQLEAKTEIVRDCLRRIAGIADVPDFEIVAAPNQWHYRARAQWQFDSVRQRLGYFEANSHRVCDVAECAVLAPELQSELERLRRHMSDGELPDNARYFRAIAGDDEISIVDDRGESPIVKKAVGVREITRTIYGDTYRLSAENFFQTNVDLLPQLIDEAVKDASGARAVELYCGVGLFTLPLARRFQNVVAIEDDANATGFALRNLGDAGFTNAELVKSDVAAWLDLECAGRAKLRQRSGFAEPPHNEDTIQSAADGGALQNAGALQIDFLLLDPPRTGAESRVINGILRAKPRKICYVSCDPATLARDLKKLIGGGYTIESIKAFDMFPQTHHVETVVHMTG